MKMFTLALALVTSQALAPSVFAQDKVRADVKAEAASAVRGGAVPRGEVGAPDAAAKSTKDRTAVKAEAIAAGKAGAIPKGEASIEKPAAKSSATKKEKAEARAKRKAETADANKARALPKGEVNN